MTLTNDLCSVEGCEKPVLARGWCGKHYARWRKHGDPDFVSWTVQRRPADGLCTVGGCNRPYYFSGVCVGHYARKRRRMSDTEGPLEDRTFDSEAAFAERTQWVDGCLEWVGWVSPDGYGKLKRGGRHVFAHRYAWERVNGPIPEGAQIDHICHNPACCNVHHLRLATHDENVRNLSGAKSNNKHSHRRNVGKMGDRWRVRITKDGTVHYFGTYETIDDAARVAEEKRRVLFGQFAGKG